jgi:RNA recognition motif-containing protein
MQGTKLFVGNLSHCVIAEQETQQLRELFASYGDVVEVKILTGKRYGFVEMSKPAEAEQARRELDEYHFNGCRLKVSEAGIERPKRGRGYRTR